MPLSRLARLAVYGGCAAAGAVGYSRYAEEAHRPFIIFNSDAKVPSRKEQLRALASGTKDCPFDVLIVGGGATGTGCAVDAATRYVQTPS